jgi:hypothetical protein
MNKILTALTELHTACLNTIFEDDDQELWRNHLANVAFNALAHARATGYTMTPTIHDLVERVLKRS